MLRELLAEQVRRRGAESEPETLRTRQFLAVNLGEAGYREEAVAILRGRSDRRRVLGPDDDHTLRTAHMLSRLPRPFSATPTWPPPSFAR